MDLRLGVIRCSWRSSIRGRVNQMSSSNSEARKPRNEPDHRNRHYAVSSQPSQLGLWRCHDRTRRTESQEYHGDEQQLSGVAFPSRFHCVVMTSFHDGSAGNGAIFCFAISISFRTSIGFEGHGGMTALSKDRPLERAAYRASEEAWSKAVRIARELDWVLDGYLPMREAVSRTAVELRLSTRQVYNHLARYREDRRVSSLLPRTNGARRARI
jgi:hypothetical protein